VVAEKARGGVEPLGGGRRPEGWLGVQSTSPVLPPLLLLPRRRRLFSPNSRGDPSPSLLQAALWGRYLGAFFSALCYGIRRGGADLANKRLNSWWQSRIACARAYTALRISARKGGGRGITLCAKGMTKKCRKKAQRTGSSPGHLEVVRLEGSQWGPWGAQRLEGNMLMI